MGVTESKLSLNEQSEILENIRADVKQEKLFNMISQNISVSASQVLIEHMQSLRKEKLVEAVSKNDLGEVQKYLKDGKSTAQEFGSLKISLLHVAVYYGASPVLRTLMQSPSIPVNACTSEGDTPLMLAILTSESDTQALKMLNLLVSNSRIAVETTNSAATFPALSAVKKGYTDCAKALLSPRFIQNYSTEDLVLVCKTALRFHNDDVIQTLLTQLKDGELKKLIQQISMKAPCDQIIGAMKGLSLNAKGDAKSEDTNSTSEKSSEDAADHKLYVGNHVQTLSKETIRRFLPPSSSDDSISKIAGQKAIIHNIIQDSLYIELVDANCMAAINSKAVVLVSPGKSSYLADESVAKVGSYVKVVDDPEYLKSAHGETKWRHGMEETCGRTGRVVRFNEENWLQVQFAWGSRFYYNSSTLLASDDANIESRDSKGTWYGTNTAALIESNNGKFKSQQEELGLQADVRLVGKLAKIDKISIKPFSTQKIVRIVLKGQEFSVNSTVLQVVTHELDSAGNKVSRGDSVKLRADASKTLQSLQTPSYGGYAERILQLVNQQGVVESIVLDGRFDTEGATVKVRFTTHGAYYLHPKALVLLQQKTEDQKEDKKRRQLEVIKRSQLTTAEKLGEGGFGSVFKGAWTVSTGKVKAVAIKQINYGVTSCNVFEDILKEAKTQFALNHPNIISIYGISYGPQQDLWLIMKLVEGRDLNSLLFPTKGNKKFELPFKYKVKICMDIAYAIAFIHDKGYLHADIKPNNMMVNMKSGRVYLCDFGITRYLGNMDLHTFATKFTDNFGGTLLYVAPECLKQDKDKRYLRPTFKSDVWSLGASFYEIFTEKYLFDDGMVCFQTKIKNDSEYVQKLVNYNVQQEVRTIIKKMLDFIPSRRSSMYELTDLLHSL